MFDFILGKGTQCLRISEVFFLIEIFMKNFQCTLFFFFSLKKYGHGHLSAGDLLREEAAKPDSSLGQEINDHIKNGTIVPVAITCKLLENVRSEQKLNEQRSLFEA